MQLLKIICKKMLSLLQIFSEYILVTVLEPGNKTGHRKNNAPVFKKLIMQTNDEVRQFQVVISAMNKIITEVKYLLNEQTG